MVRKYQPYLRLHRKPAMISLPIAVGKNQKLLPLFSQIYVFLNKQERIPLDPTRQAVIGGEKPGGVLIGICPAGVDPKGVGPNGVVSKSL